MPEDLWTLQARLRCERNPTRKPRLHVLVLLKSGHVTTRGQAAASLARHRKTVALWLRRSPYREGGLAAVLPYLVEAASARSWPRDGLTLVALGASSDTHYR